MSFNGSGTFTIINTFVPSTTILSAAVNQNFTDIATGLTNTVCKDGQQTLTANIPMSTFKLTGLGSGSARTDSLNLGQDQDGKTNWVAAGGTSDAITATYSPAITALTDGQLFYFRATAANASTTPTFIPNGVGSPLTITKKGGGALIANDIPGANAEVILRYNNANTRYELLNPTVASAPPPAAAFKNLAIKVATNTTVNVTADFVTMTDGTNFQTLAINSTGGNILNLGSAGAVNQLDAGTIAIDTWYYIWAIATPGGSTGSLASTSGTSPSMPSGYTFKARIGAVQTIHGSATLYGTWQLGRRGQYVVGLAQTANMPIFATGIAGSVSVPTYVSKSLVRFVPSTASEAIGVLSAGNDANSNIILAPNNSYGAMPSTTNPPPVALNGATSYAGQNASWSMMLESTNLYYAASGADSLAAVLGWIDNI